MAEPATEKQSENRKVPPKKPVIGKLYFYFVILTYFQKLYSETEFVAHVLSYPFDMYCKR